MAGWQKPRGLNRPCFLLIVIAGMERFAFKGVASNMVTYLTDVVKMSNSAAAKTVNNWCGFTSMLPLLVASLADYWDRYSTILTSSFLYVVGLVALTSTALAWATHPTDNISSSYLFWSLCLISLGQGGYNPSLQAFGADQIPNDEDLPRTKDEQKSNKKSLFFQWWYFWGFAVAASQVSQSCPISKTHLAGSLMDIVRAIKEAVSKLMNSRITLPSRKPDVVELELQEKPLCQNSGNAKALKEKPGGGDVSYLVQNGKAVLRLLPIWSMLLMFAVIFQQPATFFTKQGMTMKRNVGSGFKIPPATLQSCITVSIILLMPFYDVLLIPLARMITRDEKGISVTERMGVGMVLSIIAMAIAALVETKRLEIVQKMEFVDQNMETEVPLSIFWLLPQYILLGISDIFTVVGMQEFFYSEVPVRMRTMGIALYTSVFGVGSFLSALLISLVEYFTSSEGGKSWFSDDMREARLDKYYWLLALLSALSLMFYVIFCRCFVSRSSDLDTENS
ncbi:OLIGOPEPTIDE TRANSPORTER-RELATED [Salix purpurea]|uniref:OLIGOPEPTIDE TRANSPORTER-RELATED n=1 Tax=Salix purpurea TaxID=77065 RepID=A0A9Q0WJ68_SALPP|nr:OLIGOPEPTIDE TRANSPORTER-RELATED [Salix purpurea]